MKPALLVMFAAASPCFAQWSPNVIVISTGEQVEVEYTLDFLEVDAVSFQPVAGPNGELEPGEAALMRLNMFITTPVGTPVITPGLHGYPEPGVLGGFCAGDLNIVGDSGGATAQGTWVVNGTAGALVLGRQAPFNTSGPGWNGTPAAGGARLVDVFPAQFGSDPTQLSQQNPVEPIWQGVWIPSSFALRTVAFTPDLGSLRLPTQVWGVIDPYRLSVGNASSTYSGVAVHVLPSPAAAPLVVFGSLVPLRRRRR